MIPDVRNSQYVPSGADGGSVDEQFYGVRQIPLSFFVLVEHDGKLAEMHAEMAKLPEPSRFVTSCECSYSQPDVFIRLATKLTQPLIQRLEGRHVDHDIELGVAATHECMIYRRRSTANHARASA